MRRGLLRLVRLLALLAFIAGCTPPPAVETSPSAITPAASPAVTAAPSPTPDPRTRARVEMDVYQDRPNPTWELSVQETNRVIGAMFSGGYPPAGEPPRCADGPGYHGFVVTWIGDEKYLRGGPETLRVCGGRIEMRGVIGAKPEDLAVAESATVQDLDHALERFLLETARPYVDAALYESVRQEIARLTVAEDATPFARSRIGRHELATGLPTGLPGEAPVYAVLPGPVPEEEWARRVAEALGFTGGPASESHAAAQPAWMWAAPERDMALTVHGNIAYQCSAPPAGEEIAGAPESAEQAVAVVRAWLTARELLPADCADDAQAWPGTDGLGWEVRFRRRLGGLPVGSEWSCTGGLQVRLDSLGRVEAMTCVRHDVSAGEAVPLRPIEEAWQELVARRPAFFDAEGNLFPQYDTFTIDEVELGYYECCFGSSEVQTELRPYYVFSGEAGSSWQKTRMAAYVPASK